MSIPQDIDQQVARAEEEYSALQAEDVALRKQINELETSLQIARARQSMLQGAYMTYDTGLLGKAQKQLKYLQSLQRDSHLVQIDVLHDIVRKTLVIVSCSNKYAYCREAGLDREMRVDLTTGDNAHWKWTFSPDDLTSINAGVKEHRRRMKTQAAKENIR